jgi:hypothetical protein
LRGDSCAAAAAAGAGAAGAGPLAAAGRATLGAGFGCAGAAGRGEGADAAVDAALAGAAVHAGADAAPSTIPQWTQNFAPGWFSLPHAVHFIDGSSHGNLGKALTGAMRMKCGRLCAAKARLIMTPSSFGCHFTATLKYRAVAHRRLPFSPSRQPPLDATIEHVHPARLDAGADSG